MFVDNEFTNKRSYYSTKLLFLRTFSAAPEHENVHKQQDHYDKVLACTHICSGLNLGDSFGCRTLGKETKVTIDEKGIPHNVG